MENPSRIDQRRIWTTGLLKFVASGTCTAFRRHVAAPAATWEEGRRLGLRLAERFRGGIDAAAARLGLIASPPRRSLVPIAIDDPGSRAMRPRAIRRR